MTRLGIWTCAAVAAILLYAGAERPAPAQSIVGWTCLPGYGGCDEFGNPSTFANATVGLPFEWHLVAGCNTGGWNLAAVELQTGRLPPGLEFEYQTYSIVGVPARAGSFSFRLLFRDINCPGVPISDWTRDYTIVATGN